MRSTKNRRAVIVGIVIFIGVAIFVLTIFTLGGQKKTFSKSIHVKAIFDDVNGLQAGNNVWYSGMKVGSVKSTTFTADGKVEVTLNVDHDIQKLVHKDAKAKIASDGLIGNRIVVIYGGTAASPTVAEGDRLNSITELGTQAIMDTLQYTNRNLMAITGNMRNLTDSIMQGRGTVGKLLTSDDLAVSLQQTINILHATAENSKMLSANLNGYIAKFNTPGSFANDLATDTTLFHRLRNTTSQLQQAADKANAMAANLQVASNKINDPNGSAIGVLLNDPQAAANLRTTLANMSTGTAKLNDDLEAAQHNFLLRGFFKKKAKREEKATEDSLKNLNR